MKLAQDEVWGTPKEIAEFVELVTPAIQYGDAVPTGEYTGQPIDWDYLKSCPELFVPLVSETGRSDLYYAVRTVVRAVVGILACEAAVAIALALAWLIWTLAGVTFA